MSISYIRHPDCLHLFAWHEVDNYGDRLGPALFQLLTGRPVYIEARGLDLVFDKGPRRLIHCFLGTMAHLLSGPHRFVLWGFGTAPPDGPAHHGCRPVTPGLDLEFRALRGPRTRKVMADAGYEVPETIPYGDPGLLAPYFYQASPYQTDDFCIVPHHSHYEAWRDRFPGANVIDIRLREYEDLQKLILQITKYRVVFSSSLHVTMLAESFGIPACPVDPTLPFKFEDFYEGAGKSMPHVPGWSRPPDWKSLYEEAVCSWKPIRWDPARWLAAAPFPLPNSMAEELGRHYGQLAESSTPEDAAAHRGATKTLFSFYEKLHANAGPPSAASGQEREERLDSVLFEDHFDGGLDRWYCAYPPDGSGLQAMGCSLLPEGFEIRGLEQTPHIASPFVDVGQFSSVAVEVNFMEVEGTIEIFLQDEHFNTIASATQTSGGESKCELRFWPTHPEMRGRVVFVLLRGRAVLGSIRILGFAVGVAKPEDQQTLSAPVPPAAQG